MAKYIKYILPIIMLLVSVSPVLADATCGITDYSGNRGRLYDMCIFVLTMCYYVLLLCDAIAGVLVLYGAITVYIKLNTGDEGFMKACLLLVGSCIFFLVVTIVLPAFFGVNYGVGHWEGLGAVFK